MHAKQGQNYVLKGLDVRLDALRASG